MAQHTGDKGETDVPAGLSEPARRAPAAAGAMQLEHVTTITEAKLLKLHGIGLKAIALLQGAMEARGLSFADAGGGHA
ncbi:MAG TPA: DNA-binding protein [Herpetosiphonaceae bacterium]|nr:DNA-binding protein [Herpetosiphonaceae bacterium]